VKPRLPAPPLLPIPTFNAPGGRSMASTAALGKWLASRLARQPVPVQTSAARRVFPGGGIGGGGGVKIRAF
jgi:hypothetical protein